MGTEMKKIWNAEDVAAEALELCNSQIHHSSLTVDTRLTLPQITPHIIRLCKDVFGKWFDLHDSSFSVETVAGGITNLLLKVSIKEQNECFTVRLFGPNTDHVINRERELQAIKYLSAAGFGAQLLGVFGNGMVQSFINARTLTPPDIRDTKLAAEIAKELSKFHQVEIPGSKEPQLWIDMDNFFKKASALSFDDAEKQNKYRTISFEQVRNEIDKLKELTSHLNSPVVFAHNDLLCGNIMVNEAEEKLYFIDFEYGSYNYRGFDIGNHFNEYAGYECDYTLYPTKDEQCHFFRNYLNPDGDKEVSDEDIESLYVETSTYTLASHLYWALWALILAKLSPIDFDYLEYFFLRYNQYKKQNPTSMDYPPREKKMRKSSFLTSLYRYAARANKVNQKPEPQVTPIKVTRQLSCNVNNNSKSVEYQDRSNEDEISKQRIKVVDVKVEGGRRSVSQVENNLKSVISFLQVKVMVTDMPGFMQVHAFKVARTSYDSLDKLSHKHIAFDIKKEFDRAYGPAWHCIVGSCFGSFVTHSTGGFLYFSVDNLCILLFQTKVLKAASH